MPPYLDKEEWARLFDELCRRNSGEPLTMWSISDSVTVQSRSARMETEKIIRSDDPIQDAFDFEMLKQAGYPPHLVLRHQLRHQPVDAPCGKRLWNTTLGYVVQAMRDGATDIEIAVELTVGIGWSRQQSPEQKTAIVQRYIREADERLSFDASKPKGSR